MSDLDRDLREMFRRREGDVLVPSGTPAPVLRRTKRRQLGTVLAAAGTALVLITAAVAGAALLRDGSPKQLPGVDANGGMRTTTGPYATATYPNTWLATVDGPDLALTNFDPGLDGSLCRRIDATMPDDGVALLILPNVGDGIWRTPTPDSRPWPVTLGDDQRMTDPTDCLGARTFRLTGWSAPNGVTFRAFAVTGPDPLDADVDALDAAFASLTFPADDRPAIDPDTTVRYGHPGLVLESGNVGGVSWNLVAFDPGGQPAENGQAGVGCVRCRKMMLEVEQSGPTSSDTLQVARVTEPEDLHTSYSLLVRDSGTVDPQVVGAVVYGTVGDEVARAEALGSHTMEFGPYADGARAPARLIPAPPSLGIGSSVVVGTVEGALQMATVVGFGADGSAINEPKYATGEPEIIGRGTEARVGDWNVAITPRNVGASLHLTTDISFIGDEWKIDALGGELFGDWQVAGGATVRHLIGLVRADAARVDIVLEDGTVLPTTVFPIPDRYLGPTNAYIGFVPIERGTNDETFQADLVAYDANGVELGREPTSPEEPAGPTPEIDAAWTLLRTARDELTRYGSDQAFDELEIVATIDSKIDYLVYGDPPQGRPQVGRVTIRVDSDHRLVMVTRAETGEDYCVGVEIAGSANYRYGALNALHYNDCTGGWS